MAQRKRRSSHHTAISTHTICIFHSRHADSAAQVRNSATRWLLPRAHACFPYGPLTPGVADHLNTAIWPLRHFSRLIFAREMYLAGRRAGRVTRGYFMQKSIVIWHVLAGGAVRIIWIIGDAVKSRPQSCCARAARQDNYPRVFVRERKLNGGVRSLVSQERRKGRAERRGRSVFDGRCSAHRSRERWTRACPRPFGRS